MDKSSVIEELRRVAMITQSQSVSRSTFERHATISSATVEATFGSWNEGVVAAGLIPLPPGGIPRDERRREERLAKVAATEGDHGRINDDVLLDELIRVRDLLGRRPSLNQVTAKGRYNARLYVNRWGSIDNALAIALDRSNRT